MAKLLVECLLFASGAVLAGAEAVELRSSALTQAQLYEPGSVAAWLRVNGEKADKGLAARFYQAGEKQKRQRRWGPAGKSFAASALYYPHPRTLNEYAETKLIFLGVERRRDGDMLAHAVGDLQTTERLYRSVIAADEVLHVLSLKEKQRARGNADCTAGYVSTRTVVSSCEPLRLYGLIGR